MNGLMEALFYAGEAPIEAHAALKGRLGHASCTRLARFARKNRQFMAKLRELCECDGIHGHMSTLRG
jgi:hypothetical protein